MSESGYFFNDLTPEEEQQQRALAYAQAIQRQGMNEPPKGAYGGLAGAGNQIVGALLARNANKKLATLGTDRQSSYARALGNALGPSDNSAWDAGPELDSSGDPGQISVSPRVGAPLAQRIGATMNPDLMKQMGPQLATQQMQATAPITPYQQAELKDRADERNYQRTSADYAQLDKGSDEIEAAMDKSVTIPKYEAGLAQAGAKAGAVANAELPAKIAADAAKAAAANAPYDPETIDFMAKQALAGDKSVFQQLGYGGSGSQNRAALRNAVTKIGTSMGVSGPDLAALNAEFSGLQAGERTLGNRTANIEMAATEAQQMAPLALQASAKVDRTQFPTLNSLLLAAEKGTGGEDVVRLGVATNSLINIYARAISPTGVPTVSDKDHARELLSSAWAKGQYAAGIDQMMKELGAARAAPGAVRGEFRNAISGGAIPGAAPVPGAPSLPTAPFAPGNGHAPMSDPLGLFK